MSLSSVAAEGDQLTTLIALRDLLADRLELAGTRDVAAIAARLKDVLQAIAALHTPAQADAVDEIAKRRAARQSAAQVQ